MDFSSKSTPNAINRLREVLGDSADSPRYIETLPRRGYRFIAGNVPKPGHMLLKRASSAISARFKP